MITFKEIIDKITNKVNENLRINFFGICSYSVVNS